jgi:hypothetical protein
LEREEDRRGEVVVVFHSLQLGVMVVVVVFHSLQLGPQGICVSYSSWNLDLTIVGSCNTDLDATKMKRNTLAKDESGSADDVYPNPNPNPKLP